MIKHLLVAFALALCACGSSSEPSNVDGAAVDGSLPFGAHCNVVSDMSSECASGVCTNTFDMLGIVCSQKCTMLQATDPSCPVGSMGQKCNLKGYCRP
jgi:hypothetical protein